MRSTGLPGAPKPGRKGFAMRLIDLWSVTDGQKMFIKNDRLYTEVMDGPGYPVVDGKKASDLVVDHVSAVSYPMYGNVIEIKIG